MEFHPLRDAPPAPASSPAAAAVEKERLSPATLAERGASWWHAHPGVPDRSAQTPQRLSRQQLEAFDRDGYLLIRAKDVWTQPEMRLINEAVDQMGDWPEMKGKWMKYFETNRHDPTGAKLLARIENFTGYNPGLNFLLQGDKLPVMASDLFAEQSIMYKEKVNYKLPGGAGFAPHQDVAAGWWLYDQSVHISCLVGIDSATLENGCLEVVSGRHLGGMLSDDWKEIPADIVAKMKWDHVTTEPGDVLFFDSYVPHRSAENNTNAPRRVLYVTYAKASEGDHRERYYKDKRAAFPPDIERDPAKKYEYKI